MDSLIHDLLLSNNYANHPVTTIILATVFVWSLAWKGYALWYSAQNRENYWFVAILILNTVGILEIAYLFIFSKNKLQINQFIFARRTPWTISPRMNARNTYFRGGLEAFLLARVNLKNNTEAS